MAVVQKKIRLVGTKGQEEVEALFDSGATYSCIVASLAEKLDVVLSIPEPIHFEMVEKGKTIKVDHAVRLDFWMNGYRFSDEFFIIQNLSENLILGAATMQKWRFKLDFENDEVIIDPRVTKLRLL